MYIIILHHLQVSNKQYTSVKDTKTAIRRIEVGDDNGEVELTLWRDLSLLDIQVGDTIKVTDVKFNERTPKNLMKQINSTNRNDVEVKYCFL